MDQVLHRGGGESLLTNSEIQPGADGERARERRRNKRGATRRTSVGDKPRIRVGSEPPAGEVRERSTPGHLFRRCSRRVDFPRSYFFFSSLSVCPGPVKVSDARTRNYPRDTPGPLSHWYSDR